MYNDIKETPPLHDTIPLETTPTIHNILELDSETTAGYNEDTNYSNSHDAAAMLTQKTCERIPAYSNVEVH